MPSTPRTHLLRDDPIDVVKANRLSGATLEKIEQNLVWALGYDTAMVPLTSLGLLQPVLAAGARTLSSVSVLSNGLLFRRYAPEHDYELLGRLRRAHSPIPSTASDRRNDGSYLKRRL